MTNNVFANGLEIACKAADGLSRAAFPDPCFTPPPPSGGWILVPYANTAYAKDLANGTTSVFISGLQVAKKDFSYIKTSTGNEPAAGPKGKSTGVKKGKAYFTSWSMNVMVEGMNVCRHTDSMTHNHASWSGNTSNWVYLDTAVRNKCNSACVTIEKACGKKSTPKCFSATKKQNKNESKAAKEKRGMKNAIVRAFKKWAKKNGFNLKMGKSWKFEHCIPYLIANPGGLDKQIEAFDKQIDELENTINNLPKQLKNVSDIVDWKILTKEAISAIKPEGIWDLLPVKRLKQLKRIVNTKQYADTAKEVAAEIKQIYQNTEKFLSQLDVQRKFLETAKKNTRRKNWRQWQRQQQETIIV
jgi:archaellum component FlaC